METTAYLGNEAKIDLYGCDPETLKVVSLIESILNEAAINGKATIVSSVFHQFLPVGVSGIVVISESHIAIHTWPEHGYAAVDVFTCGAAIDLSAIVKTLTERLKCSRHKITTTKRGYIKDMSGKKFRSKKLDLDFILQAQI